jgi:hypothetical protein
MNWTPQQPSPGEREKAIALFLSWKSQSNKLAAGSGLSTESIPKRLLAEETGVPVIKEVYARRSCILELHLSLCSEYRIFRVDTQPGTYFRYLKGSETICHILYYFRHALHLLLILQFQEVAVLHA